MLNHKLKNFLIIFSILITGFLSFINYQGRLVSALNGYSCNHYTGQCFADSRFAKYTDKNTCSTDCATEKFKYYCNTYIGQCVPDFRGTYADKDSCWSNCKKNVYYSCDGFSGACVPSGKGNLTYLECTDSCRSYKRVYYCAPNQHKCIGKSQIDMDNQTYNGEVINLNNLYSYNDCWGYCMGKNNQIPKKVIYTCDECTGKCGTNPSGEYSSFDSCDSACASKKRDCSKDRYLCDPTKGCVLSSIGNIRLSDCKNVCKVTAQ